MPTTQPTGFAENLENRYYIAIGASFIAVIIAGFAIRFDMAPSQKERVSAAHLFGITFAWIDFLGDISWTHMRFHENFGSESSDEGKLYGVLSLCVLVSSVVISAIRISQLIRKNRKTFIKEKLTSVTFITTFFLSWTDPDAVILFPFKDDAYDMPGAYPNKEFLQVTLVKLVEDVPEFFIQIAYLFHIEFDTFTALNLLLTLVALFYMVAGKLFFILFVEDDDENIAGAEMLEMVAIQGKSTGKSGAGADEASKDTRSLRAPEIQVITAADAPAATRGEAASPANADPRLPMAAYLVAQGLVAKAAARVAEHCLEEHEAGLGGDLAELGQADVDSVIAAVGLKRISAKKFIEAWRSASVDGKTMITENVVLGEEPGTTTKPRSFFMSGSAVEQAPGQVHGGEVKLGSLASHPGDEELSAAGRVCEMGLGEDLAELDQADVDSAIAQGPPTTPPVVTGGLGRGFWPKRPLRIPLGFHMKIAPESKNKWPNTVISV